MTLIRPEQSVHVEGSPELSLEQRILGELSDIKDSQTFMRVVLLGGTYRDVSHAGKLPEVEAALKAEIEEHGRTKKRVIVLEEDKISRDAALRATKVISGVLAAAVTLLINVIIGLWPKH